MLEKSRFNPEEIQMVQKLVGWFALSSAVLLLSACNTMEGFGKDVQKVGGKIEQKADEKK